MFTTGAPASHAGELTPPPEPLCAGEVCVVTHLVNQIHLNWRAMVGITPAHKRRPPADGGDGRVAVRLLLRPDMRPIACVQPASSMPLSRTTRSRSLSLRCSSNTECP